MFSQHDLGANDEVQKTTVAGRVVNALGELLLHVGGRGNRRLFDEQAHADPAGPLAVVAIVRLAVAMHRGGGAAIDEVVARGGVPEELAEIARSALAA